jgi:hypothetical protein
MKPTGRKWPLAELSNLPTLTGQRNDLRAALPFTGPGSSWSGGGEQVAAPAASPRLSFGAGPIRAPPSFRLSFSFLSSRAVRPSTSAVVRRRCRRRRRRRPLH